MRHFNFSTLVGRFGEIRMLDPDASQGALAMWQCSPASAGTLSNEGRLAWAHGVCLGMFFIFHPEAPGVKVNGSSSPKRPCRCNEGASSAPGDRSRDKMGKRQTIACNPMSPLIEESIRQSRHENSRAWIQESRKEVPSGENRCM